MRRRKFLQMMAFWGAAPAALAVLVSRKPETAPKPASVGLEGRIFGTRSEVIVVDDPLWDPISGTYRPPYENRHPDIDFDTETLRKKMRQRFWNGLRDQL